MGSLARRRGCDSLVRRSRLPGGKPRPCTASSRIRVISCERVRCSAAARRRSDSFRWLGTYAPIKTPLRLAIYPPSLCQILTLQMRNRSVSRILYFDFIEVAIIHLVQPLPAGSSDLPGGRSEPKFASGGQPCLTPPYLVLHREEFAWPRMSPHAPVRSYRTISPITRCRAGLFSVALVVAQRFESDPSDRQAPRR